MKYGLLIFFSFFCSSITAQVLIHAHNDYEKAEPLFNALRNRVYAVEADVFWSGNKLLVAHEIKDIDSTRTLTSLYLEPIEALFQKNKGFVSADKSYKPTLVIDIKSHGEQVIAEVIRLVQKKPAVYDRRTNPNAIQILFSGDRGEVSKWKNYPRYIFFDGRPFEKYDKATLAKVVTISDSYGKYLKNNKLNTDTIQKLVSHIHTENKLFRLWGAPDFPNTWKLFSELGIDIINTDKIENCRKFFANQSLQ
jgi:alkaline phosphatase